MTQSTAQGLTNLAARLTKPEDRETYAGLVSYFQSLPDHDELFRLVELLGLLTLLGQRVPDALADAMTELRELSLATSDYHVKVDERLADLPKEITTGVDVGKLAKDMSEAFRQQLANTGLETSAAHLRTSTAELTTLSVSLKPVCATIADHLAKMTAASADLRKQNAQLRAESDSWLQYGMLALVIFVIGVLCGITFEKNQTADVLASMSKQMERIQTPVAVPRVSVKAGHSKKAAVAE